MNRAPLPLLPDEAHLWLFEDAETNSRTRIAAYEALLTKEETERYRRFRFEAGQLSFLATRALVRTVLSAYAPDVSPKDWRFDAAEHGRPHLSSPDKLKDVSFNLSNTRGLVACVVARGCDAGVDVERFKSDREISNLSHRFFAESEAADVGRMDETSRLSRFYGYWTLKESYIKARGLGLSLPLGKFAFTLDAGGAPVRFTCDASLNDRAEDWQFAVGALEKDLAWAVALRRGAAGDRRITLHRATPLDGVLS